MTWTWFNLRGGMRAIGASLLLPVKIACTPLMIGLVRIAELSSTWLCPSRALRFANGSAFVAALAVFGFASTGPVASGSTFVGKVEGSDAYIAISKEGRKIGGYLCDSSSISRWLEYAWLEKGRASLTAGTTGELLGSVQVDGNKATGTIEIGGQNLHFVARRVRGPDAGLFFGIGKQEDRLLVGGWILDPDGTQRGAVSRLDMRTLTPLSVTGAPKLDPRKPSVQIGEDTSVPAVQTEPQQLVVINIIAILIGLLLPAVQ
jgi:hypothetical protein